MERKKSAFDEIVTPVNFRKIKEDNYESSAKFISLKLEEAEDNARKLEENLKKDKEALDYISPTNENRTAERAYLISKIANKEAYLASAKEQVQCYKTAYEALTKRK